MAILTLITLLLADYFVNGEGQKTKKRGMTRSYEGRRILCSSDFLLYLSRCKQLGEEIPDKEEKENGYN